MLANKPDGTDGVGRHGKGGRKNGLKNGRHFRGENSERGMEQSSLILQTRAKKETDALNSTSQRPSDNFSFDFHISNSEEIFCSVKLIPEIFTSKELNLKPCLFGQQSMIPNICELTQH